MSKSTHAKYSFKNKYNNRIVTSTNETGKTNSITSIVIITDTNWVNSVGCSCIFINYLYSYIFVTFFVSLFCICNRISFPFYLFELYPCL